jgi:Holliday junction DNA helicase RuvA
MISKITGLLVFKGARFVVAETGGIGYKVYIGAETYSNLPKINESVSFWVHFYLRENRAELYGFLNYPELEFFEQLIQISGVGPKNALGVLSAGPIDTLKKAVSSGETSYLTKVSGIGRKLAEKIIIELKNKMAEMENLDSLVFKEESDAIEALRSLGYSLKESREAMKKISKETKGAENIVKEALKNIARQ